MQKILWVARRLVILHVCGARDKLMPVFQDSARDERGVFEVTNSEGEVHAFGDVVHDSIGDEDLNANVWIWLLKSSDYGRKQCVRNAGRRGKP